MPLPLANHCGFLSHIKPTRVDSVDMTGILSQLIELGCKIEAVPQQGGWGEVDSAADLTIYEDLARQGHYPWLMS